jgi:hypothetical protein
LYGSRSIDGGSSWSKPEIVVEADVRWSRILASPDGTLQRFWQTNTQSGMVIWQQVSRDSGASWELPVSISSSGSLIGAPYVSLDAAGQTHLQQLVEDPSLGLVLKLWVWDGGRWLLDEPLGLAVKDGEISAGNALAVSPGGWLVSLYLQNGQDPAFGTPVGSLYTSRRMVQLPAALPTPIAQPTSLPATSEPTAAPTPTQTPPPVLISNQPAASGIAARFTTPTAGLMLGAGLAVLIVSVIFAVRLLEIRRRS